MIDFAAARRSMVEGQVRTADVTDLRLQGAMLDLPRERFVPAAVRQFAYLDRDLPLGPATDDAGPRMLLKPMLFAKMLQTAGIAESDRVLDVGCGTGYGAAVLSRVAREVIALESDAELARQAVDNLAGVGAANVQVVTGPLPLGFSDAAPYDLIVVEGASEIEPRKLCTQLAPQGRLVCVLAGPAHAGKAMVFRAIGDDLSGWPAFDAAAPLLPGFAKPPAFAF